MSGEKCPFCGGELCGCIGHPYCRNEKCVMCDDPMPQELLDLLESTKEKVADLSDKIGKLEIELDRTKKQMVTKCNQLEIAVSALDVISQITNQIDVCDTANDALNTITAQEQKD